MRIKTLTVTELNNYISKLLNTNPLLHNVSVSGEVFNFKKTSYGYSFFSLKDSSSKVNCIIFKSNQGNLEKEIINGISLKVNGKIKVYEKAGNYSLIVKEYIKVGDGELYLEFLKIKDNLQKKGYFDVKYKKNLLKYPQSIGIITSIEGAAIGDIINTINRRYPLVNIKVYDSKVQGKDSVFDIIKGINYFDSKENVDTLIIARGGGAFDDLSIFNDESLAKAIFSSNTPIVSAIGHEMDFFISDLVADARASTPTAAAEITTPNINDILDELDKKKKALDKAINENLLKNSSLLNTSKLTLEKNNPVLKLEENKARIVGLLKILIYSQDKILQNKKFNLENIGLKLNLLNPLNILEQGYAVVQKEKKQISSIKDISINDQIIVKLHDGDISANISHIKKKNS